MDDFNRRVHNTSSILAILKSLHTDATEDELAMEAVQKETVIESLFNEYNQVE